MRISDWSSDVCSSDLRAAYAAQGSRGRWRGVERGPGRHPPADPRDAPQSDRLGADRLSRFEECALRSEEHTSELQSLMRISYAVFCLKKKINRIKQTTTQIKTQ